MTIESRKDAHIDITKTRDVQYRTPSGFSDVQFVHNALPQISREAVDCTVEFLGKKLAAPLLITGMTGGTPRGEEINRKLAQAAQDGGIAFGLGSCRPMLENAAAARTYDVRKLCPDVPLLANIGAVQLKEYKPAQIEGMVSKLEADALNVHLNALQEAVQPEGQTDFSGVEEAIGALADTLAVPLIAKETGAGINGEVASRLMAAGCAFVEVSGSGGTSWSRVEYERGGKLPGFEDWGYPTVAAVAECAAAGPTICSGGVRDGIDAAKGIALGAKLSGAAMPFIRAEDPGALIGRWTAQIRTAMFLCGAKDLDALGQAPLLITGHSARIMQTRGIGVSDYAMRAPERKTEEGRSPNHYL